MSYHKLSTAIANRRLEAAQIADNTFRQTEALLALYRDLDPPRGLPPTRGWAASPDFLRVLSVLIDDCAPLTVVECGSGLSTLVAAACLRRAGKGRVFSMEHDAVYAEKTRKLLRSHGLEEYADIIDAPLVDLSLPGWSGKWYDHSAFPPRLEIDLLVVDGPPWFKSDLARYPALPLLRSRLSGNAQILLDDADRDGEQQIVKRWLVEGLGISRLDRPACEKGCVILGVDWAITQ